MKFCMGLKQFNLNILILLLIEICRNKGNECFFAECIKQIKCWHAFRHINGFDWNFDQRYYWSLHFDTSLYDLTLIQGHMSARKQKLLRQLPPKLFDLDGISCLVETLMWWISYTFYFVHSVYKGEKPTYVISFKTKFNFGLYSNIFRPISFKLDVMIGPTKFYILISVWMTLTFIRGHSCVRNQKLWCPFSQKFCSQIWLIQFLATICWFFWSSC